MSKEWLAWLEADHQEHCWWAINYLGQRGQRASLAQDMRPLHQRLQELVATWPPRDEAKQVPQDPVHSLYLMLELRMRSAYFQWKKRREDKSLGTYNFRMRKDLRPFLHRLAKRQQLTINEAVEDLVRREDQMSRDFTTKMKEKVREIQQDKEHKEGLQQDLLERHLDVINKLTRRVATLEFELEGLAVPSEAPQEDAQALMELLNERATKIKEEYRDELSRIPKRRGPRPVVSRAAQSDIDKS